MSAKVQGSSAVVQDSPGTLEGLGLAVLLTKSHETGHLALGELDLGR